MQINTEQSEGKLQMKKQAYVHKRVALVSLRKFVVVKKDYIQQVLKNN